MRVRQAHIDLAALHHNFALVRRSAPQSAVLAMLKSNAYGHGLERIAKALPQADAFGVACVREVERLREAGIRQDIVLMTGFHTLEELHHLHHLNASIVVHSRAQLDMLASTILSSPIRVWLKVDIGMARLGFSVAEIPEVLATLQALTVVAEDIVLLGHFSDAADLHSPYTAPQLQQFHQLTLNLQVSASLANSAGILTLPTAHYQWVRPGIMLYGASPCDTMSAAAFDLRPVMTLKSRLLSVQKLAAGARVSYGGQFSCPEPMPVGVVEMGYGDGYPRHAENGTPMLVSGKRCPLIGRVCMDMMMVDLRNAPHAEVGDEVVLWGDQLPIEEIATSAKTIAYELLCHVSQRVDVTE
ncbi:MAG: alanine racemase [Pseudomonadota bacterium]|nr:alanine racemase [Pseudomonadota bacterium]